MDKQFAFESEEVSIAFTSQSNALGDVLIVKSVFDAIIKLVPNCKIDIFYTNELGKFYIESFYGQSKNLNRLLNFQSFYAENVKKYDLAVRVWHTVLIDSVKLDRLKSLAPSLLRSVYMIILYNKNTLDDTAIVLRNITRAHILGTNRYTCLSCGGALPIRDNHVEIPLTSESEHAFQKLGLSKNYITIGSNLDKKSKLERHSLKEWATSSAIEYISLLNMYFPQIEIVQIGGGGVEILVNADRHIIDADLELVKYVLKNSLLHVDCESGLVHLATQLGTKCLVLFGPTDVEYYGFKENINLVSDVCYPCVWAWDDGSTCLRGAKEPPCILSHTPKKVFEATSDYLNNLELKI